MTDRYVLEYLHCSRGMDTESKITCSDSALRALDKSSLSEEEKASLKAGMHEIRHKSMVELSNPPKTSVRVNVVQNPNTDKFEYAAVLASDDVKNARFYSDSDMLVNFVLESTGPACNQ